MTVENCIRRYKEFVAKGNVKAAESMKKHMLEGRKFKVYAGYPFNDLFGVKKAEPEKPIEKIEEKKDGKKSKR